MNDELGLWLHEMLRASNCVGRPPESAESFYRSWSTASGFVREEPPEPERIPEAPLK